MYFLVLIASLHCKVIHTVPHRLCCAGARKLQSQWCKGARVRLHYQVKVGQVPLKWDRTQKENRIH